MKDIVFKVSLLIVAVFFLLVLYVNGENGRYTIHQADAQKEWCVFDTRTGTVYYHSYDPVRGFPLIQRDNFPDATGGSEVDYSRVPKLK
jgi:hypothetical protein